MAIASSSCSSSSSSYSNPYDHRRTVLPEDHRLRVYEKRRIIHPKEEKQSSQQAATSTHHQKAKSAAAAATAAMDDDDDDLPRGARVPPPYIIVVQGPPKVGKSLLIKSLVKHFTNAEHLDHVGAPITVPVVESGNSKKQRLLQFVECPNDVNGMIDAAKYADMVLLLIDASYGFEMETFEFHSILHVHHGGFPNVVAILTHLDEIKDEQKLTETKQRLTRQFRKEIYDSAELFYLSRFDNGMYRDCQFHKLATFMSVVKIHPLSCRTAHPYVLVDRFECRVMDNKCRGRNIILLYGYLRGTSIKRGTKVHIAGVGDFLLDGLTSLAEPCSLPSTAKMKGVSDEERFFYPPLSGLGDIIYGENAEYMDEVNDLGEVTLSEIEVFRTGSYLRLEVRDVPFQMVENFDPRHPILVGGISLEEEEVGYMQARLKRHSWHMRLLKTRDPIIVSAGWRRYWTRPIYAMEDGINGLHRNRHYTPERTNFLAMFWGPRAPPNTRLVAVHDVAGNKAAFRIAATGVVLDLNRDAMIVKKCRWIKEGGAMQTASRFRWNLKKASREELMRRLKQVVAPRFFDPFTAPLESSNIGKDTAIVGELKDSPDKDDPARRRQTIEQRRAVVFVEGKQFIIGPQLESHRVLYQGKRKLTIIGEKMPKVEMVSEEEKRLMKESVKRLAEEAMKRWGERWRSQFKIDNSLSTYN